MTSPAENTEYDAIEIRHVEDILDCTPDSTEPLLLTQAAVDATDEELLAVNRGIVSHVLDSVDDIAHVSQDALRGYYLDFYTHAIEEVGLSGYRARSTSQVDTYVMQALKLASAQQHLDLFVSAVVDPEVVDDGDYAARFAEADADQPIASANATYLREHDGIQILSEGNLGVALDIVLGDRTGRGGVDVPRWNGVVADVPVRSA